MHRQMQQTQEIEALCPTCGQAMTTTNGLYLRELRQAAQMTQRKFGRIIKMSSPYISDIERNRRACPPAILKAYLRLAPKKKLR